MASADNELDELRRRAYGRGADIHLDAAALARLRELEGEQAATVAATEDAAEWTPETPERPEPSDDLHEADAPRTLTQLSEPSARPARAVLRDGVRWLSKLRRSTVLIVLTLIVVAVLVAVSLTLVQRVQTDPLQAGASQIARLTPDSRYPIPSLFGGPGGGNQNARAYQEFHGLRTVISTIETSSVTHATMVCLSIYSQEDITDPTSTTFSGQFFNGCGAGTFPAAAQFDLQTEGLPQGLRAAVAPWTALQFVYDKRDHEVVVFGSK